MAHLHADGTEETRPRTPEEIRAIEEQNRIAARSNVRSGKPDRRVNPETPKYYYERPDGMEQTNRRKNGPHYDRRKHLSDFEREFLMAEEMA